MHYFDTFTNFFNRRINTYILFNNFHSVNIFAGFFFIKQRYSWLLCLSCVGSLSLFTAFYYIEIDGNFVILSLKSHLPMFAYDAIAVLSMHAQKWSNMIVSKWITPNQLSDLIWFPSEESRVRWTPANQTFRGICTNFTKVTGPNSYAVSEQNIPK